MFRKSRVLSLVAVSAVLLLALGCQQAAAPQPTPKAGETPAQKPVAVATATKPAEKPVRGGTIRMVTTRESEGVDPHVLSGNYYTKSVYDTLIWHNQDLDITKEGLTRDWTISADGKSVTLKLREGVKFHDGTDFDAAAVKFNIERIKDPATKAPYGADLKLVTGVEVLDRLTVRLNLSGPDPLLLTNLGYHGTHIVSPAAVKKYGVDFPRQGGGTGPFQLAEWVPGSHVTMKRFEGYWKKDKDGVQLPYLEQIVYRVVPDGDAAFANLRTGQADHFDQMTVEQLPLLKSDPNLTYTVNRYNGIQGLYLNTKRPPFDNKALRQVVALALNREGIAARKGESATLQASILHPMTWGWGAYDDKTGRFPDRDLAKARAKMAEAGYAGGLKVTMPIGGILASEAVLEAQIVKANLAEIGIETEIEALASTAATTRVRNQMNYQISISASGVGMADPGAILGKAFHSKGSRNYYGPYGNPQVDQLLDKAGGIYDQKERTALYREAATIIADEAPFIPLYVNNNINGMSKKVRNFVPYPENHPRLLTVWLAQ